MTFTFTITSNDFGDLKEYAEINISAPNLKEALKQFPNYHRFIEEAK